VGPADTVPERARSAASSLGLDDGPLPTTVLRLPDLATQVKSPRPIYARLKPGAIAQWTGIGLGGVLAVWLIFGGHGSAPPVEKAPAWTAPAAAPASSAAPAWNGPGSSGTHAPRSPAAPSAATPPPNSGGAAAGEFDPFNQLQPGGPPNPAAAGTDGDAARVPAPGNGVQPDGSLRTARRPEAPRAADGFRPSEAQPLDVTVPVPQ
jgi:hypothetical protein